MVTFISGPCLHEVFPDLRLDYKEKETAIQPFSARLKQLGDVHESQKSNPRRVSGGYLPNAAVRERTLKPRLSTFTLILSNRPSST